MRCVVVTAATWLARAGSTEALHLQSIRTGILPPTMKYTPPDPECVVDCTPNEARHASIDVGLSSAFGFGGHNSVLVFRRFDQRRA